MTDDEAKIIALYAVSFILDHSINNWQHTIKNAHYLTEQEMCRVQIEFSNLLEIMTKHTTSHGVKAPDLPELLKYLNTLND